MVRTEKRFTLHKGLDTLNIMDNTLYNEHIYVNKSSKDMALVVELLNTFNDENEQLKSDYEQLKRKHKYNNEFIGDVMADCDRLEKENRQLKYQNEMLQEELRQAKAVINKEWSKYLQQKEKEVDLND